MVAARPLVVVCLVAILITSACTPVQVPLDDGDGRFNVGWFQRDAEYVGRLLRDHGLTDFDIGLSNGYYLAVGPSEASYADRLLLIDSRVRGWEYKSLWIDSVSLITLSDRNRRSRAHEILKQHRIPSIVHEDAVRLYESDVEKARGLLRSAGLLIE